MAPFSTACKGGITFILCESNNTFSLQKQTLAWFRFLLNTDHKCKQMQTNAGLHRHTLACTHTCMHMHACIHIISGFPPNTLSPCVRHQYPAADQGSGDLGLVAAHLYQFPFLLAFCLFDLKSKASTGEGFQHDVRHSGLLIPAWHDSCTGVCC